MPSKIKVHGTKFSKFEEHFYFGLSSVTNVWKKIFFWKWFLNRRNFFVVVCCVHCTLRNLQCTHLLKSKNERMKFLSWRMWQCLFYSGYKKKFFCDVAISVFGPSQFLSYFAFCKLFYCLEVRIFVVSHSL